MMMNFVGFVLLVLAVVGLGDDRVIDGVPFDVYHSAEYREQQHAEHTRRNLQSADMKIFNDMLKQMKGGILGDVALPRVFGSTPTLGRLSCDGFSINSLATNSASGNRMRWQVQGLQMSCSGGIAMVKDNGDRNNLDLTFGTASGSGLSMTITTKTSTDANGDEKVSVDDCSISFNPSLTIKQENAGFFAGLLTGAVNSLIDLFSPAIGGIIGGLACAIVENIEPITAITSEAKQSRATSAFLQNNNDVKTERKTDWFNFASFEQQKIRESHLFTRESELSDTAFDFSSDPLFQQLSLVANELLGVKGTGPNSNSLVVNQATSKIAKALGDPTGSSIALDDLLGALPPLTLSLLGIEIKAILTSAKLRNVDTFTVLDVLRTNLDAKQTLNNKFAMDKAGLDITIDLQIGGNSNDDNLIQNGLPGAGWFPLYDWQTMIQTKNAEGVTVWEPGSGFGDGQALAAGGDASPQLFLFGLPPFTDTISVSIDLENLAVDASLLVGIDTEVVETIPLGGLISENILDVLECTSTSLYALQIPTLGVSVELANQFLDIDSQKLPGIMNFLSGGVNLLAGLLANGLDVGPLVSGLTQQLLNGLLESLTSDSSVEEVCNNVNSEYFEDELRPSGDIQKILPFSMDFLMNEFLGVNGDLGLNRIGTIVTVASSGVPGLLAINDLQLNAKLSDLGLNSDATISLNVDLQVSNITTISPDTVLLQSPEPFDLVNRFILTGPLVIVVDVQMEISGEFFEDGQAAKDEFRFELNAGQIGADTKSFLQLDLVKSAPTLIGELSGSPCPLQPIGKFAVLNASITEFLTDITMDLRCTGTCTSSVFDDLGAFLRDPTVRNDINTFVKGEAALFLELVLSDPTTWALFQQLVLDGPLGDCALVNDDQNNALGAIIGTTVGFVSIGSVLFCGTYMFRIHRKNKRANARANWRQSIRMVHVEQSLAFDPATSKKLNFVIIAGIITTISLFTVGLLKSIEVNVSAIVTFRDGTTNKISPNLDFGGDGEEGGGGLDIEFLLDILFSSSNAFLLAISIGMLSGALPFVWMILLLFGWLSPTTILSPVRRGKMILLLNSVGKWTLLLPFLLAFLTAGIRFKMSVEQENQPDVLSVDIFSTPSVGLFLFCMAVVLGMTVSKMVLFQHRKVVVSDASKQTFKPQRHSQEPFQASDAKESASQHIFRGTETMFEIKSSGQHLTTGGLVLGLVLLIVGLAAATHKMVIGGVAGAFVAGFEVDEEVSFFDVIGVIASLVEIDVDGFGLKFTSILAITALLGLVLFAPLMGSVIQLVLWAKPLSIDHQNKLFQLAETVESVSAVTVYAFTLLLIILQLNTDLIQAVVDSTELAFICGSQDNVVVDAAKQSGLVDDAQNCLELDFIPLGGFFALLVACLLKVLSYQIVMRASNSTIEDRQLQTSSTAYQTDALFSKDSYVSRAGSKIFACFITSQGSSFNSRVVAPHQEQRNNTNKQYYQNTQSSYSSGSTAQSYGYPQYQNTQGSRSTQSSQYSSQQQQRYGGGGNNSGRSNQSSAMTSSNPAYYNSQDLPPGWRAQRDPQSGRYYYANYSTGIKSWSRPV